MLKTAGVSYLHLMLTDSRLFTEQQEKRNSQQPKIQSLREHMHMLFSRPGFPVFEHSFAPRQLWKLLRTTQ